MPQIILSRAHTLPTQTIKDRLTKLGESLKEKYQATTNWSDDRTLNVKGTGIEGKLVISEQKVDVNLDLKWMLTPMKGAIEERLKKELETLTQA